MTVDAEVILSGTMKGLLGILGLAGVVLLVWPDRVEVPSRPAPVSAVVPSRPAPGYEVLATHQEGGWLSVDILSASTPLDAAKDCVARYESRDAVSCYTFSSLEDRVAAEPISAGNFRLTCFSARWTRNKLGSQSGGVNTRPGGCPGMGSSEPVSAPSTPSAPPATLEVTIDARHEMDGAGRIRIVGSTNLPDGTALSFSLFRSETRYMAQDSGEVRDGQFASDWFSYRGDPIPPGSYELSATVPIYTVQSSAVRAVLGKRLEAMTGPLVRAAVVEGVGKVASVELTVRVR